MKDLPGLFAHGPDLIVEKNLTVSGRVHLLGGKGDLFTWMDGVDADLDGLGEGYSRWQEKWLPADDWNATASNGCGASVLSNGMRVKDFDADAAEYALLTQKLPTGWTGGVRIKVWWTVSNTDAGNVRWRWRVQAAANGEVLDTVTNELVELSAAPGVVQEVVQTALSTLIERAAGDLLQIEVYRDAANAGDTYASDAHLVGVELFYQMEQDGVEEL